MTSATVLTNLLQDYKASSSQAPLATSVTPSTANASPVTDAASYGDAYVLDLSQAAQDILNSQNTTGTVSIINLTDSQKQKLQSILDKYKDAPINSDALSALNTDLKAAGLMPEELASTKQALDYDPKTAIIKLLGFSDTSSNSATDSVLSGLSAGASGTPIGDLLQQYMASLPHNT